MKPLALEKMTLTLNRKVRGSQTVEELARLQGNVRGSRERKYNSQYMRKPTLLSQISPNHHTCGVTQTMLGVWWQGLASQA